MKRMTVAVCLDDRNGMSFGGRRQSRDRLLIADFMQSCSPDQPVFVNAYSCPLFGEYSQITVVEDLLSDCPDGGVCFVERQPLTPYLEQLAELIIYRWNRLYPADLYFDVDLKEMGFSLVSSCEFTGSSHDKITKEVYCRCVK